MHHQTLDAAKVMKSCWTQQILNFLFCISNNQALNHYICQTYHLYQNFLWITKECLIVLQDLLGVRLEDLGGRQTISRTTRGKPTVGDTFKHQLSALVDILSTTNPW